ncbi:MULTISPECIES: hypothetical protein [unclassified Paraburkholderia]|uniref:hypothetical protein n=1 Tax=unclassified Paraburkholderia TaxID=2615204 RepID=UPI002AAF356B|nr:MULTISPECIES: hypothetical protein [unclassified Paraburkholderia]
MFINLEMWDEEPRHDGAVVRPGSQLDAHLDMQALKCRVRSINLHGLLSFEKIRIWTIGRPRTNGNYSDVLEGVRLLLADSSSYVVIVDDRDRTFEDILAEACASGDVVYRGYDHSNYARNYIHKETL